MARQMLSDQNHGGVARILGLPNAINDNEPATLGQVNAMLEGLAWKDSVRVFLQSNVNISSPGATLDGVTMAIGDRVGLGGQTTASQNGIYIWNGAATAMTRSPDANTADELEAATFSVEEGTNANSTWRQTAVNFVIGTGAVTFVSFGTTAPAASTTVAGIIEIATQAEADAGTANNLAITPQTMANYAGRLRKFTQTIGDGSATQFDITHSFNTLDVQVELVRVSDGATVFADITRTSVNVARINFAAAPASNQYRVIVIG